MTITATIPALFALGGLVAYFIASNPKLQEVGRLAFFAGLFISLLMFQGQVRVLP